MGRLFWKIFLSFWLTLLLIISGVIWGTTLYLQHSDAFQAKDLRSRFVDRHVNSLSQVIEYSGAEAVTSMLDPSHRHPRARHQEFFILDEYGDELLGRNFDIDEPNITQHASVISPDGEYFRILSKQNMRPPPTALTLLPRPFRQSPAIFAMWLGIALLLSGFVCFWLALSITRPIRSLQQASKRLAAGELDTRVAHAMGNRRDEIADLGQDFNLMAERLQSLLVHQKQLLSDVSHELRSPLARLKVALGLAQKHPSNAIAGELKRIDLESNRLDDLIRQVLTLSRLDAGSVYRRDDYLDAAELLESIIQDCNYEMNGSRKRVVLQADTSGIIEANADLLRRALENVIRNAVRYTPDATDVMVTVQADANQPQQLVLRICDQGPGVPAQKINQLFEPFVRLSSARDRDSGGYGLGLAIAKRAVAFHNGTIRAWNQVSGGLCMEIILPTQTLSD